jgi:hypothetical protein
MITKFEINIILSILKQVLNMIEAIDPNAKDNKVFIDVSQAIILLEKMI